MRKNIKERNLSIDINIDTALEKYREFGKLQYDVNCLREAKTALSRKFSRADKEEKGKLLIEAQALKVQIQEKEDLLSQTEKLALNLASAIPNFTHPSAPIGNQETARELKIVNQRKYNDTNREHVELCLQHKMVNFSSAAQVSGAKFYYLENDGALLEMTLTQIAMLEAVKAGFTPTLTPDVVREDVVAACGFNPRDPVHNQTFKVSFPGHPDLCLAATSEIPLAAYNLNAILEKQTLPSKKAGLSHCFRAEAGSTGSESRGLYRVHQFTKVELFAFTAPEDSEKITNEILAFQERFFSSLGLHYRVLEMPTEELGASAFQKYDIEAWLPGQNRWGEISSTSNCTDYQSRRLNIRMPKDPKTGKVEFVHTVNGTGCAIPRIIVAIVEQYQDKDGRIAIPELLRPYFNNREFFNPANP
ncbi:seryl-tRNA synthetase [Entomophthora muscae]|uniref:Seryl-tRNA synthetase n=1 Tax=Entomophthora muscae TaxID=34485 RepID=A0ACC2S570_9FUNG|nr:seryl-tRNA synthetase [Entomophthora muscae]